VSVVVVTIALAGFTASLRSSQAASETSQEMGLAQHAARTIVEQLQAETFVDVFALYNGVAGDDPEGAGTGPGSFFTVEGLNLLADDADGFAGEIVFPTLDGAPGQLREDAELPVLGLPRDLDGDGAIDGFDHSADYQLLPVLVRVSWRSSTGQPASYQLRTLLANF